MGRPHYTTIKTVLPQTETHFFVFFHLHPFVLLSSLSITAKTFTEKHSKCIHTAYVSLGTLLHAFFYSVRLFPPSTWSSVGVKMISISHFFWILLIFLKWMMGDFNLSFLWVYSSPPSLFLSLLLWFSLPPSRRLLSIHSLFKHGRLLRASGNEVSPRLRWAAFGLQLFPHVGHRYLHVAPSVCPTG